jgi:hypothetical protein
MSLFVTTSSSSLFSIYMASNRILYERTNVSIRQALPSNESQTTLQDIIGTIVVLERKHDKYFQFTPTGLAEVKSDDWAMVNGSHAVLCYKNNENDSISIMSKASSKFHVHFNLNDLQSVRQHQPSQGNSHLVITLKDGKVLPTFYFNLDECSSLFQLLRQCLPLEV